MKLTALLQIDYDKLANLAGYTVGSARTNMGTIRRKLKQAAEEGAPGTPSSNSKRKTGTKSDLGSPTKRPKGKANQNGSSKKNPSTNGFQEEDNEDDDGNILDALKKEEEPEEDPFTAFDF